MAATLEALKSSSSPKEDDETHLVCCFEKDRAFCGRDMTGADWVYGDDVDICVPCDTINEFVMFGCPFGKNCPE